MKRITKISILSIPLFLNTFASMAQSDSSSASKRIHVGIEQDMLPYILHGFIGTAWVGKDHWRVRVSYAEANTPSFVLQEGFRKDRTHAVGVSAEYFWKEDFKGLWFGPGIGYWNNEVITNANYKEWIKTWVFSLGGGYTIYLWKGLYTTPWLALHTRVIGNGKRMIDNHAYTPMLFTPEASIKLGWKF